MYFNPSKSRIEFCCKDKVIGYININSEEHEL